MSAADDPGGKPGGAAPSPAESAESRREDMVILAETQQDWDAAIDEWDRNLRLGEEAPLTPARAASDTLLGTDEVETLPAPPATARPLPDFQQLPSIPPTLISDLDRIVDVSERDAAPQPDIPEAELPQPPPASQPPSQRSPSRSVVTPSRATWRGEEFEAEPGAPAPPLPPPPAPSSRSNQGAAGEDTASAESLRGLDEAELLAPRRMPDPGDDPEGQDLIEEPFVYPRRPASHIPVDDEFYDTISIEKTGDRPVAPPREAAARPEKSVQPRAQEARAAVSSAERFSLPLPAPGPAAHAPRASDPPGTILMEAELPPGLVEDAPPAKAAPIIARRLPLPDVSRLPAFPSGLSARPACPSAPEQRQLIAVLDEEAKRAEAARPVHAARLKLSAAGLAEGLGEMAEAQERYRAVLEVHPASRPAMRGLRRLLSQPGPAAQPDEALALLDREAARAGDAERTYLGMVRGDLLLLTGQADEARAHLLELLSTCGGARASTRIAIGVALLCAALQEGGGREAIEKALSVLLSEPGLASLRGSLTLMRARLMEDDAAEAASGYRQVAEGDGQPELRLLAALGLLRLALRGSARSPERAVTLSAACLALGRALSASPLRTALLRVAWRLAPAGLDRAADELDELLLQAASADGDRLSLADLADGRAHRGQLREAAAALDTLINLVSEPDHRAALILQAALLHERAGLLDEALARAREAARLTDAERGGDAVVRCAIERLVKRLGTAEDLIALGRHRSAERSTEAALAHATAARMLLERGTPGDSALAVGELKEAVAIERSYGPWISELRRLLIDSGELDAAAAVLEAAAEARLSDARGDAARQVHFLEDAARLLARQGRLADAGACMRNAIEGAPQRSAVPALHWQMQRLLSERIELSPEAEPALAASLAECMRAEAETTSDRYRAADLWFRRGLLLTPTAPLPTESEGPVEDSLRRALAIEPGHGPALLALTERTLSAESPPERSELTRLLIAKFRERLLAATGRPEAVVLLLRLSGIQEREAADARGALMTLNVLRTVAPAMADAIGQDLLRLARKADDKASALELLEHALGRETDNDLRLALLLHIGELHEAQGQPRRAADFYERAMEVTSHRGHPVVRSSLARAYERSGQLDKLASLVNAELAEATDVASRVGAFERMAVLASLDPERRGDPQHVIDAYRSILEVDANNQMAMRVLERHFIATDSLGELIHLYQQMGLTATERSFAVHVHLERARLRQRLAWRGEKDAGSGASLNEELHNELENDFRLALYRNPHSRPALRYILAVALRDQDLNQVADISLRLAELCDQAGSGRGEAGDGRAAAVFLTRAAECYAALAQPHDMVTTTYKAALARNAQHVPAARGLLRYALMHQLWEDAATAAELCAGAIHNPAERYQAFMLSGAIAKDHLSDIPRALLAFREAQRIDPRRSDAFDRMRMILMGHGGTPLNPLALSELIGEQLQIEEDLQRQIMLRLELATLLSESLANRARAKVELRQALAMDASHPGVLELLAALHYEDGEWAEAADLLIRRARVERRAEELVEIFLRLGSIYSEHIPDPRRAIAAYTRALELQPDHTGALSQLSALQLSQQRPEAALPHLRRLADLTTEREQKVGYLHRVARLYEGLGDLRAAQEAFRHAVEVDPLYLPAIGELAHFFDRQSDVQSMRVHLDSAAARWRQILREHPDDLAAYQALLQIYEWRRAVDQATMAAAALMVLGGPEHVPSDGVALLERERSVDSYPGPALRDPGVDEILFPSAIPAGFRTLFTLLHEPLAKLYRVELKQLEQLGIGRRERLPRSGHPVRDLANRIGADMGAGEFEVYLTQAKGHDDKGRTVPLCTVEATEPPSLILSQALLTGATEGELRFLLGRLLKLVQTNMVLPLRLSSDDLGLLVGALVKIFVKDHVPLGFAEKRVALESQRLHKAIPKKLESQVLPLAMECSSMNLDVASIESALITLSNHAGLLVAGTLGSAHAALRRLGPSADQQLKELIMFAVSSEFAELRRLVGTSLG